MSLFIHNEKIVDQVEKDVSIDKANIKNQIENQPYILHKYQKRLNYLIVKLRDLKIDYEEVYGKRYTYYKEKYDPILSNASEIKAYTAGDSEVLAEQRKINEIENNIDFLKDVIDNIKHKYFNMKLLLDYKKFESGEL